MRFIQRLGLFGHSALRTLERNSDSNVLPTFQRESPIAGRDFPEQLPHAAPLLGIKPGTQFKVWLERERCLVLQIALHIARPQAAPIPAGSPQRRISVCINSSVSWEAPAEARGWARATGGL